MFSVTQFLDNFFLFFLYNIVEPSSMIGKKKRCSKLSLVVLERVL